MKLSSKLPVILLAIFLFGALSSNAQSTASVTAGTSDVTMKTYLIKRDIPAAGKLTPVELKGISQKSCSVLEKMGPSIQWVHSYVTGNNIYCIYRAQSEELLREHAKRGGFPINEITEIATVISPATAK